MAEELRLPPEIERYYEKWRKDPRSKIFAQLADAYRKIGMLDEAIDVCLQGLKVHPSYVSARMVLARAYLEKDMDAEAESELSGVLGTDPGNILASRMLADLLYKKGNLPEAVEQYQRLLKLSPLDREIKSILEKAEAELKASPAPVPSPPVAEERREGEELSPEDL
ncbi:MAG: tetratricopeptide repeat protein, partial [candidate division NC10 bacterium]|nr:tetratricopeptide repeat protein [candidate division NC10 bacterium]